MALNPPLKQYNVLIITPINTDIVKLLDSKMMVLIIFPSIIKYGAGDIYRRIIGIDINAAFLPIYLEIPDVIELIFRSMIRLEINSE